MPTPATARGVYRGSPGAGSRPGMAAVVGYEAGTSLDLDLRFPVASLNGDGSQATVLRTVLTLKANEADLDPDAVAQVEGVVTTQPTALAPRGRILFALTPLQTRTYGARPLFFSVVAYLSNGRAQLVESGRFFLREGYTDDGAAGTLVDHVTVTGPATALIGEEPEYAALAEDAAGVDLLGRSVYWSTSDSSVATIDQTGKATVLEAGAFTVYATVDGVTGERGVSAVVDDVGELVATLGGDVEVPIIFTHRKNTYTASGRTILQQDARVSDGGGIHAYHMTGEGGSGDNGPFSIPGGAALFGGLQKATWMVWGITAGIGTGAVLACWTSSGGGTGAFNIEIGYSAIQARFSSTANGGSYAFAAGERGGRGFKLAVVFDGAGATNADRLKVYLAWYNRLTASWGPDVQVPLVFAGVIPAVLDPNGVMSIGGAQNTGKHLGLIDEVRAWAGTALSAGQVAGETIDTSAVLPTLRYPFALGALANIGSGGAGYNLVDDHPTRRIGVPVDYRYPTMRAASGTSAPTYNAGPPASSTFDDVDDGLFCATGVLAAEPGLPDAGAIAWVGIMPVYDGAGFGDNFIAIAEANNNYNCWIQGAVTAAAQTLVGLVDSGPSVDLGAPLANYRVVHARRALAGGSVTVAGSIGAGAEVVSAPTAKAATFPYFMVTGQNHLVIDGRSKISGQTERAIIVLKTPSAAKRTAINTWAAAYEGATI